MNDELWCILRSTLIANRDKSPSAADTNFLKFNKPLKAYFISSTGVIDLLSGHLISSEPFLFLEKLLNKKIGDFKDSETVDITSLFYEYGNYLLGVEIGKDVPLALYLSFSAHQRHEWTPENKTKLSVKNCTTPDESEYQSRFEFIQQELKTGNSYQVNLTDQFKIQLEKVTPDELTHRLFDRPIQELGDYAHAINIPSLKRLYICNSPESLFDIRININSVELFSKPIKGTMAIIGGEESEAQLKLAKSVKDQSELFMITDLIRNDLSRISDDRARVNKKKAFFTVPGLVHQYSEVSVNLRPETNLLSVIEALFPGGSITGAPKKSTAKIIQKTEKRDRGFYCGTTLFWTPDCLKASINIRGGEYQVLEGQFLVGAGGGITVNSQYQSEFQEMTDKFKSFAKVLLST